jgi:hypothetical protein
MSFDYGYSSCDRNDTTYYIRFVFLIDLYCKEQSLQSLHILSRIITNFDQ